MDEARPEYPAVVGICPSLGDYNTVAGSVTDWLRVRRLIRDFPETHGTDTGSELDACRLTVDQTLK